ncbi:MAG: PPC domain-containing protein [Cyanobacteria bacterium P01_A01_bin.37]
MVRFLMPLVGLGGLLGYWHTQGQPHADAFQPKNISSHLFASHALSRPQPEEMEGDRSVLIRPANEQGATANTTPSQYLKQESIDDSAPDETTPDETTPDKQPNAPSSPPLGATNIVFQTTGILENGDQTIASDQSLYDEYSFEGRAGQPVIITLESTDFDTYLILVSPDQRLLNENDDISEANSNSSLTTILPVTGTYLAIANAFDSSGQGNYTLTVREIVGSTRAAH